MRTAVANLLTLVVFLRGMSALPASVALWAAIGMSFSRLFNGVEERVVDRVTDLIGGASLVALSLMTWPLAEVLWHYLEGGHIPLLLVVVCMVGSWFRNLEGRDDSPAWRHLQMGSELVGGFALIAYLLTATSVRWY